jgi:hypothetical protein
MQGTEVILAGLGAVLTLMIFSYLLGDNPLFRLALHIFIGVSAAYVLLVAVYAVFLPLLTVPDTADPDARSIWIISLVGVALGVLLFARRLRFLAWLSDISLGILVGVGVGVALAGALIGTLTPQVDATTNAVIPLPAAAPEILRPIGQVIAFVGTITGLLVFSFVGRRPARRVGSRLLNGGARIGRWFVLIGFGAAFGGLLAASVSFFADRIQYLVAVVERMSGG